MDTNGGDGNESLEDLRCLLGRIADKWTVLVLGALEAEPKRFSQLKREIGGVSQKMLTQTLRALEREGLVRRTVYAEVPPRVVYALTPLGRTLCEPLKALQHWAAAHHEEVLAAREAYDAGRRNA